MYYLAETDPRGAMGLGGKEELNLGTVRSYLAAIDYKTGKTVWRHVYPHLGGTGAGGVLSTAGKLVFVGDVSGNLVAYDSANGKALWHSYLGTQVLQSPVQALGRCPARRARSRRSRGGCRAAACQGKVEMSYSPHSRNVLF
jgi:alcohol dehydrogenase (cytochrome c)